MPRTVCYILPGYRYMCVASKCVARHAEFVLGARVIYLSLQLSLWPWHDEEEKTLTILCCCCSCEGLFLCVIRVTPPSSSSLYSSGRRTSCDAFWCMLRRVRNDSDKHPPFTQLGFWNKKTISRTLVCQGQTRGDFLRRIKKYNQQLLLSFCIRKNMCHFLWCGHVFATDIGKNYLIGGTFCIAQGCSAQFIGRPQNYGYNTNSPRIKWSLQQILERDISLEGHFA